MSEQLYSSNRIIIESSNHQSHVVLSSFRPVIYHDPDFTKPKTRALHLTATSQEFAPDLVSDTPPPLFPLSPTRRHPNGGGRTTVGIERRQCISRYPAGWSSRREHRWRQPPRTPALRPLLRRHFGLISRALPPPMMTRISVPFATDAFVTLGRA